jgi:integration host factor subunit beta
MTKKEIVKQIADKLKLPQIKTKEIVQLTFDLIVETLVAEGRIELRNFGVFEVKRRKPRKARNPRTGHAVQVEAKNVVTFQPGKVMEDEVKKAQKFVEPKRKVRKAPTNRIPVVPAGEAETIPQPSENGVSA